MREPPFVGGKSDKAAIKFGYFAAKPCPRTGFDRGQDITDGCGTVLHGRGQGDIFPLLLRNADVIIRANEPVAGCGGGCGGRIATGENDLCAGAIPIVCGQFCVILGIKIVAIGVTQADIFTGEIGSCGIRALHKAIAIADHRRNCHISEEAKLLITLRNGGVSGKIARLCFVEVQNTSVFRQRRFRSVHVQTHEINLRIAILKL